MCEGMCFFFFAGRLSTTGRVSCTRVSIRQKAPREKVPGARCCQVPIAACCLLSARYSHPEQAPASGPPPCPPAPSKRHLAAVEPGQRCTLRSSCMLHCLLACLLPTFFCRRSAGSPVRPKLASCRAPSRTLILRLHAHLCGSPPMAAPRREMPDRPTVRQSLCATRPVVTAAVVWLLPSFHPFLLHTVACVPLLHCYFWRFDGEALHRSGLHGPNALANLACHKTARGRSICCKNHCETRFCSTAACSLISWSVLGALR
jgi:hypothetical protein